MATSPLLGISLLKSTQSLNSLAQTRLTSSEGFQDIHLRAHAHCKTVAGGGLDHPPTLSPFPIIISGRIHFLEAFGGSKRLGNLQGHKAGIHGWRLSACKRTPRLWRQRHGKRTSLFCSEHSSSCRHCTVCGYMRKTQQRHAAGVVSQPGQDYRWDGFPKICIQGFRRWQARAAVAQAKLL